MLRSTGPCNLYGSTAPTWGENVVSALLPLELTSYGPVRVGLIVDVNVVPSRVLL